MPTTDLLALGFVALAVALAAGFVAAVFLAARGVDASRPRARRDALLALLGAALWMGATGGAAAAGRLRFDGAPPTMIAAAGAMLLLAVGLGISPLGGRMAAAIPLWALIGWQGFRLPLEVLMHRAYEVGLMPVQMSYAGLNFDVVTGLTAPVVAALLLAGRAPRWLPGAWNALGALLLANVLTVAFLSAPTPLRLFRNEPANVWITLFPYVWLPTVMVATAILGHILVLRRLRAGPGASRSDGPWG